MTGVRRLDLLPLELLYEAPGLSDFDLPDALAAVYGGSIGFPSPRLCASVTAGLDGVFRTPSLARNGTPAQVEQACFLAGLLRACVDAVVVSGNVGVGRPDLRLGAEDAYPPAAPWFAQLRRLRGRSPRPKPVVLLSDDAPVDGRLEFADGTLVFASGRGARSLRARLPGSTALIELSESSVEPVDVVEELRGRGHELILCEGCPAFVGAFLEARLVDELFLAHAPLLGRRANGDGPGSQDGRGSLMLDRVLPARLLSLRRAGSHVFSRYELDRRT